MSFLHQTRSKYRVVAEHTIVDDYDIVDYGTQKEHCDAEGYDEVAIGAGKSFQDALIDAAEQLEAKGWHISKYLNREIETADHKPDASQHYACIRVKGPR
jgi:hypothetical protein